MVSDFFYPSVGGIELHIWSLAQELIKQGHQVIVITHKRENRIGVRTMSNGLKVLYIPWKNWLQGNSFPTFMFLLPLLSDIIRKYNIEVIHGHGAASSLVHESLLHGKTLGLTTLYSDHSLFTNTVISHRLLNSALASTLIFVDEIIAVSEACRTNLLDRTGCLEEKVSVIANGLDRAMFKPNTCNYVRKEIKVVFVGRLVFRKGIKTLCEVIRTILVEFPQKFPKISFLIVGDGPKRHLLEVLVSKYSLSCRVELTGSVEHDVVPNILRKCDIFLNCSLTESFGSSLVEAAACGLLVVSTGVDAIPSLLKNDVLFHTTSDHSAKAIINQLSLAIMKLKKRTVICKIKQHEIVTRAYSWNKATKETLAVYRRAIEGNKSSRQLARNNIVFDFLWVLFGVASSGIWWLSCLIRSYADTNGNDF